MDNSSGNYSGHYTLDANGNWAAASGTGSSSGGGNKHSTFLINGA